MYGRRSRKRNASDWNRSHAFAHNPGQFGTPIAAYRVDEYGKQLGKADHALSIVPSDWQLAGEQIFFEGSDYSKPENHGHQLTQTWISPEGERFRYVYWRPGERDDPGVRQWLASGAPPAPQTVPDESGGASATTSVAVETGSIPRKTTNGPPPPNNHSGRISAEYREKLRAEAERFAQNSSYATADDLAASYQRAKNVSSSMVNITIDSALQPIFEGLAQFVGQYTGAEAVRRAVAAVPGGNFLANSPVVMRELTKLASQMGKGVLGYANGEVTGYLKNFYNTGLQSALSHLEYAVSNPRAAARSIRDGLYAIRDADEAFMGGSFAYEREPVRRAQLRSGHYADNPFRVASGNPPRDPGRSYTRQGYGDPDPTTPWSARPSRYSNYSGYRPAFHKPYPLIRYRRRRSAYVFSR